jgi:hypothetical protein
LTTAESRQDAPRFSNRLRIGPLTVWVLHVSVCYALISIHRHLDLLDRQIIGAQTVRILLLAVTAGAVVGVLVVLFVSYRDWRKHRDSNSDDRRAFTAGFTALASAAVVLYLLWSFIVIAVADL